MNSIPLRSLRRRGFTVMELFVCLGIISLLMALLIPAVNQARSLPKHSSCKNNLKQIGLALLNYHDAYGTFPPAYTVDADGKPLHSWRTLILPYLDQADLYSKIDLSKPWADPVNAQAAQTPLAVYSCPSSPIGRHQSNYLAIVTKDNILQPGESRSIDKISDGTRNTLLVLELPSESSVPWMSPLDADNAILAAISADKSKHSHTGGYHCLIADGSVRFLSQNLDPATFRALLTASGKETIGEY